MFMTRSSRAFRAIQWNRRKEMHVYVNNNGDVPLLVDSILNRALSTLSTKSDAIPEGYQGDVSEQATTQVKTIISSIQQNSQATAAPDVLPRPTDLGLNYGRNPTITSTALAHSLWSYVIRPDNDTVIDATSGNGGDAVALAQMLFTNGTATGELLCIDIQSQACENTKKQLSSILPQHVMENNVRVLHTSHAPLPHPRDTTNVALVVYNLGFLPQSDKEFTTQTETTLKSLADAALILRVGGLLSVMTYPRTNSQEDKAVHAFLEGLALFTSVTNDWREYVDQYIDEEWYESLSDNLEHVWSKGHSSQTWRVHEHKKMGWNDAPILLTATRIK